MHERLIPKIKEIIDKYSKNYKVIDSEKSVKLVIKDLEAVGYIYDKTNKLSIAPEHGAKALQAELWMVLKTFGLSNISYSYSVRKKVTTYMLYFRRAWAHKPEVAQQSEQIDIVYDPEAADVDAAEVLEGIKSGKYVKLEEVAGVYKVFDDQRYLGRIYYLSENPRMREIHEIKDDNIRWILRHQEVRIRYLEDIFLPHKYNDKYKSLSVKKMLEKCKEESTS